MALTKAQTTLMWVLTVLLAGLFVVAGAGKLIGMDQVVQSFQRFGYPGWFRIIVGIIEVACGVALLFPKFAIDAASFLVVLMLGAVLTELIVGDSIIPPLIVLILVGGLAALRGDE
jgi:uncharacterized membrane protein YphA (DoxX/SURF4 family)